MLSRMFDVENIFSKGVVSARKIVIAGIRFNDYDHELMNTIVGCTSEREESPGLLINKAKDDKEEEDKKKKIAGLFSCPLENVKFIDTGK